MNPAQFEQLSPNTLDSSPVSLLQQHSFAAQNSHADMQNHPETVASKAAEKAPPAAEDPKRDVVVLLLAGAAEPRAFHLPRRAAALCGAWRAAGRPDPWHLDAPLAAALNAAAATVSADGGQPVDFPAPADWPRLVALAFEYLALCAQAPGGDADAALPPCSRRGPLPSLADDPTACRVETLAGVEPRLGRWIDTLAEKDFPVLFSLAWFEDALGLAGLIDLIGDRLSLYMRIAQDLAIPDALVARFVNDRAAHAPRAALDAAAQALAYARASQDRIRETPEEDVFAAIAASSAADERALRAAVQAAKAASDAFDPQARLAPAAVAAAARILRFGAGAPPPDADDDALVRAAMDNMRTRFADALADELTADAVDDADGDSDDEGEEAARGAAA